MNFILKGHNNYYIVETMLQVFYPNESHLQARDVPTGYYLLSAVENGVARAGLFFNENHINTVKSRGTAQGFNISEEKLLEREIKYTIYKLLQEHTNKKSPWGLVTGIRPIKLARQTKETHPKYQVKSCLKDFYLINEEKASICLEILTNQEETITKSKAQDINLYLGIPFCPSRCVYCSFTAYILNHDQAEKYIKALVMEMKEKAPLCKGRKITSLYIGGGTPTSLTPNDLQVLLESLNHHFDLSALKEFTVEAGRPDTITKDRLAVLKKYNVSRISVNPQSASQLTLDAIGRRHTIDDFYTAFHLARDMDFKSINIDIILGLPKETTKDVENTLKCIKPLNPENITVHTLAVKRASRLKESLPNHNLAGLKEIENMQHIVRGFMNEENYLPYYLYRNKNTLGNVENIGYAKPGHFCHYNIAIMEDIEDIIALGCGAVSKYIKGSKITRVGNPKDLNTYIRKFNR